MNTTFGTMSSGPMRLKWKQLAIMHRPIFGENQTQPKHRKPIVGHWGDDLSLFWSRRTCTSVTESTINSSVYQSILETSVKPSVRHLNLSADQVMQKNNDPKHSREAETEWLKKRKKILTERCNDPVKV